MSVTVRRSGLPLTEVLSRLVTVEDMRALGELARVAIVDRTRAGRAPDGVSWPPYSTGYAEVKAKELGASPVNLTVSGEMLNNLRVIEVTPRSVTLGWSR